MVVFDSAILTLLIWPQARAPLDPSTKLPVEHCKERIELLVQTLQRDKQTILVPTPVLSEVLTVSGASGLQYVSIIQKSSVFRIEPFDTRAAIELAQMNSGVLASGDKKAGIDAPWQKIKLDRQIVAVARVAGVKTLYTNDGSLKTMAEKIGMSVIGVHELPVPQQKTQTDLIDLLNRQAASMNETDNAEIAEPEEGEPPRAGE
jgi:predicted nucleic acid-binding protein